MLKQFHEIGTSFADLIHDCKSVAVVDVRTQAATDTCVSGDIVTQTDGQTDRQTVARSAMTNQPFNAVNTRASDKRKRYN